MPRKPKDELPRLPRGMGSYTWWNDEHTMIQFRKPIGEEPYRKRIAVYGESVSECNAKMAKAEQEYKAECRKMAAKDPHNAALPLETAVKEWMEQYKKPVLKPTAYARLEGIYKSQFLPADFASKQVEQVTDTDIQRWLVGISKELSVSTVKKCHSLVNMYFEFYYKRNMQDNPMLTVSIPSKKKEIELTSEGIPVNPNRAYEVMTDDEIRRFKEEALRSPSPGKPGSKYGDYLIYLLWSFMRFGESVALQWKDVDFDNNGVNIYKGYNYVEVASDKGSRHMWVLNTDKTESGMRYAYLPDNAIDALKRYREKKGCFVEEEDFIFSTCNGTPVSNDYANRVLKSVLKRAEINKHITLHGLRHSGISFCLRHGADPAVISRMAGHSSRQVTERIYYSLTDDQIRTEMQKVNETIHEENL